jgi:diguanylate cyclase (GGDEF)-like protein
VYRPIIALKAGKVVIMSVDHPGIPPPAGIAAELAATKRRAHDLTFYDQLTGLPNRRCFDQVMDRMIRRGGPPFGLLLLDIDHLKVTNDTMGHAVGDRLICDVAEHLCTAHGGDSVFRLSSDEFAVIEEDCLRHDQLARSAARILDRLSSAADAGERRTSPQLSIGGALFGQDGKNATTIRQSADLALQKAKATNRGGYVPFAASLRTAINRKVGMMNAVGQAISDGRLQTHYQPLMRLDTREVIGLEALTRMRSPAGDVIAAGAFQAAFAEPDMAVRITDGMLMQVASDLRSWIDAGISFQHVGINLSAADFERPDLERRIAEAFGNAGVPLKHVVLEVTEAVLMDGVTGGIIDAIERLRQQGLLVALDDFGTGFASLTHLLRFPVDIIKIDKSFVDGILYDLPSEVIIEALIRIASRLDLKIVAEGIEYEAQARKLVSMGCRLGQGYLFGRAADAVRVGEILQTSGQKQ